VHVGKSLRAYEQLQPSAPLSSVLLDASWQDAAQ